MAISSFSKCKDIQVWGGDRTPWVFPIFCMSYKQRYFKGVCIVKNIGRYNVFFWSKKQVWLLPGIKKLGFPKLRVPLTMQYALHTLHMQVLPSTHGTVGQEEMTQVC